MAELDTLLTSAEVLKITGYKSRSTIWRKVKAGEFPQPVAEHADNALEQEGHPRLERCVAESCVWGIVHCAKRVSLNTAKTLVEEMHLSGTISGRSDLLSLWIHPHLRGCFNGFKLRWNRVWRKSARVLNVRSSTIKGAANNYGIKAFDPSRSG